MYPAVSNSINQSDSSSGSGRSLAFVGWGKGKKGSVFLVGMKAEDSLIMLTQVD